MFEGGRDQVVLADTQVSETFVTPVRVTFLLAVAKRRGVVDDVGVGPRFRPSSRSWFAHLCVQGLGLAPPLARIV